MRADLLYVLTPYSNALGIKARKKHLEDYIVHHRDECGVNVVIIECAYGERPFEFDKTPGIIHIGVRATTLAWNKECLINIGFNHVVRHYPGAKYFALGDGDIFFRDKTWAVQAVNQLQLHPVIQPWTDAIDLGPHDEVVQVHKSFASMYFLGNPVVSSGDKFWKFNGGYHDYPHSGFFWCFTRQFIEDVGLFLEICGMGSADHHMALAITNNAKSSLPGGVTESYKNHVLRWEKRAVTHGNLNLGFCSNTIEHRYHGNKGDRFYLDRWDMFVRHGFDPDTDLKKNAFGVIEFSGNKPELKREWHNYLLARREDGNPMPARPEHQRNFKK